MNLTPILLSTNYTRAIREVRRDMSRLYNIGMRMGIYLYTVSPEKVCAREGPINSHRHGNHHLPSVR